MDLRARLGQEDVPTHCLYSKCQDGPDGGPAPLSQTPGKRARYYCCDAHRVLAHQEGVRRGRIAMLPTPPARQVVYGDDVVTAHREFRSSLEGLKSLAEHLAQALVPAADVRAAKALVDQAEATLAARERHALAELGAEIEARIAAVDRAECADEAAEQARAGQLEAETQLATTRADFERDRATMRTEVEQFRRASEEAVAAATTRASAAEAAQERAAADARVELERIRSAADVATREARELAARAEGAREAALAEVTLAHDDARRAREEIERVRVQLEQQILQERGLAEARLAEVREQRAHAARELADERARGAARAEEVRAGLQAQLSAADQLAAERGQARDRLSQELEEVRAQAKRLEERAPTKKRERAPRKKEQQK